MPNVLKHTQFLKDLRERVDKLDQELLNLLLRRMELTRKIGELKNQGGGFVYDPAREHFIMEMAKNSTQDPIFSFGLTRILREVISVCRSVQNGIKVYYLGPEQSFTHQALVRAMGRSVEAEPAEDIEEVFSSTEASPNNLGIVPIENSLEGPVNQTYDLLMERHVCIQREIYLPITLSLLGHREDLSKAKRVLSHPYAFAQAKDWIKRNLGHLELVELPSTSKAASMAAGDKDALAIGPLEAAFRYGLKVLKESIPLKERAITRFVLLGHGYTKETGRDKTSICFTLAHRPGTLYRALEAFSEDINLCLIFSRPIKSRPWEYAFFVDFEGHFQDPKVKLCLKRLEESTLTFRLLGSYPKEAPS